MRLVIVILACAGSLQAQQFNTESTDLQRQLEEQRRVVRSPLLPEEAKHHIGEAASVRGLVKQVAFSKGRAFINFGVRYPRQVFTGFVRADNVDKVGGEAFLRSLAGNPVTLIGRIELYKGRPEIVITSPAQIEKEANGR
jgi:hypothetical protein